MFVGALLKFLFVELIFLESKTPVSNHSKNLLFLQRLANGHFLHLEFTDPNAQETGRNHERFQVLHTHL
jgi:hypothetical protein